MNPQPVSKSKAGESEALVFTKVEASRCTEDFARLLRLSEEQEWRLIVTGVGMDTRTQMGKAMARMAAVFAELERDFIRMRTHEALQVKEANGVTLGRPRSTPDDVVTRVVRVPPWAVPQRRRSGRCRQGAG